MKQARTISSDGPSSARFTSIMPGQLNGVANLSSRERWPILSMGQCSCLLARTAQAWKNSLAPTLMSSTASSLVGAFANGRLWSETLPLTRYARANCKEMAAVRSSDGRPFQISSRNSCMCRACRRSRGWRRAWPREIEVQWGKSSVFSSSHFRATTSLASVPWYGIKLFFFCVRLADVHIR